MIIKKQYTPLRNVLFSVQTWTDDYLTWDPDDYGGVYVFKIPSHEIWLPDIYFYNKWENHNLVFLLIIGGVSLYIWLDVTPCVYLNLPDVVLVRTNSQTITILFVNIHKNSSKYQHTSRLLSFAPSGTCSCDCQPLAVYFINSLWCEIHFYRLVC